MKRAYDIAIVTDETSWFVPYAKQLAEKLIAKGHNCIVRHLFDAQKRYDFCFLLSCSKLISEKELSCNRHNLVVHGSELPKGRGWSPLTWKILEGGGSHYYII